MRKNRSKFFLILYFIILFPTLKAHSEFISFNNIFTEAIWNHRIISDIEQDGSGLIWIGTDNGLYKYNGYQYYLQSGLKDDGINKLFNTKIGMLIGTNSGLFLYSPKDGLYSSIPLTNSIDKNISQIKVRAIYCYNDKYYIGTNDGLIILDSYLKLESHILFAGNDNNISSNIVRAIISDSKGYIWIGTYNGVYRLTPRNNEVEYIKSIDLRSVDPKNNLVLSFERIPNDDGHLLIGQETGLSIINIENFNYKVYRKDVSCNLSNNSIKSVKCLSDSIAIIGTDNGLNILNLNSGKCLNYFHEAVIKHSLSNNIISDIHIDKNNDKVWLATDKGVSNINLNNRLKSDIFTYSDNSLYYHMHDIIESDNGNIWIATTNGILCKREKYNIDIYDTDSGLSHNNSNVVFEDKEKRIWIGTLNGINYIENNNSKVIKPKGADTKYVRGIHQSSDGNIWIIDNTGIIKAECDSGFCILNRVMLNNKIFEKSNTEVLVSFVENNLIWLGTNSGIYNYNTITGGFTFIQGSSDYRNITAIEIIDEIIYLGTSSGIFSFDKNMQKFLPLQICDSKISVIDMEADNNSLWVITNKMLYKYDLKTNKSSRYDYVNDIPFDGEIPQCMYRSENNLIIGGYGKYVKINKSDIVFEKEKSPVVITSIIANDSIYNETNRNIKLDYKNRNIKIEFALLNYSNIVNNKYRYRLSGFEDSLMFTKDGINSVEYNNIPSGNYTFEVWGANEDDNWSDSLATLNINVDYPWWLKPWAYVLYIIIFIILLLISSLIIRWRINVLEKRQNDILKQKNLQQLNNMRMQFFANVSHEFKTPLSLILGPAEVLSEELKYDTKLSSQLRILNKNVDRLRRLVEQIMNLCKLENNEISFNPKMGDLVQFVNNIFEVFLYNAEQKNIKISFTSEAESILMMFDEDKLEEIIYNLVDNALKFTSENGQVIISIYRDNLDSDRICIEVKDTGIGIPGNEIEHIFDKFYQADNTHLADKKGTGIGLSIVKQFVEMHNGEVHVVSKQNVGTSFKVMLPIVSVYDKYVDENDNEEKKKLTVVVVEDNPDMREYLKMNLQEVYNVLLAEDGVSGWDIIKNKIPDLILSDIVMPNMDGIALLRKIRNEFQTEHIPVIFLTALSEEMRLKESLEAGVTTYITKPFSITVLKLKISSILEDRKRLQEKIRLQVLQKPKEVECESREEKFIRDFVKIVENNIDNPELDVVMLCKELGYSHQQTYRKIHAVTGKSINGFIRYIRINRAAQLLKDSDYNMSEIMDKIGMSNRTYFIKIFKDEFGMTPSEYREANFSSSD